MSQAVLEVHDLSIAFPIGKRLIDVVRGISFSVPQRCMTALVGESGSGKSVTALAIMGLLSPAARIRSGRVSFLGRSLLDLPAREAWRIRGREIGMIFQDPMASLNPVMTAVDQVIEAIRAHRIVTRREARREAIRLLERVGIAAARVDDHPHRFSGGMKQRIMIAIALANRPKLLLADEPTTALDVTVQAQIMDLLKDFQRECGTAILLITHDLGVVARWADHAIVMYGGRKVEEAPAVELFGAARHPYTLGLLSMLAGIADATGARRACLPELPGFVPSPQQLPTGCPFAPRCSRGRPDCHGIFPPARRLSLDHEVACHALEALEGGART